MRTKTVIFILLSAFMFMMAEPSMPFFGRSHAGDGQKDSSAVASAVPTDSVAAADTAVVDTAVASAEPDTTKMDSLTLAIYKHNKQVDDSIRLDSMNRKKSNSLDAPVEFSSEDSLVYDATSRRAWLSWWMESPKRQEAANWTSRTTSVGWPSPRSWQAYFWKLSSMGIGVAKISPGSRP